MASAPKRRKIESETLRRVTSIPSEKDTASACKEGSYVAKITKLGGLQVHAAQTSGVNPKIQQARDLAIAQAQQEGSKGNFRIFDSPFGNFLVPVIPTRAELGV